MLASAVSAREEAQKRGLHSKLRMRWQVEVQGVRRQDGPERHRTRRLPGHNGSWCVGSWCVGSWCVDIYHVSEHIHECVRAIRVQAGGVISGGVGQVCPCSRRARSWIMPIL
jgi:hypothetical protein